MYCLLFNGFLLPCKMHKVIKYGFKACREKVRQEVRTREEGGRGAAPREWEKLGYS